jgi:hypothetical protein
MGGGRGHHGHSRGHGTGRARDPRPLGAEAARSSGPQLSGWPRTIGWGEFQEVSSRPAGEDENAQIHSEVIQPDRVGIERDNGRLRLAGYTVQVRLDREQSWVVTSQKTAELLAHEQRHFDITGLSARDLVSDLSAIRAANSEDLQREVTRIIQRQAQLADTLTTQYDTQTDHGRNREAQSRWDAHLNALMQSGGRLSAAR